MALLVVLLVLVLGYYYAAHIPSEQIKLRRSAGWETYVYLGLRLAKAVFGALAFLCAKVKIPKATNERNEVDAKPNAFFADVV